jgi:two-component system, chemotaxis family, protein-glutamate methylesterase/glutaminase
VPIAFRDRLTTVDPLDAGAPLDSFANAAFDVIGVAASAGGLRALTALLSGLPADFPAPIAVVQHLDPRHPSLMAAILGRVARLMVKEAQEGEALRPGVVYLAPPDRHLLVNANGTFTLTRSELVHFVRPSADLLFESLAASFKSRAVAVVLTGSGSDGSLGLRAIRRMGGHVIAQDEATSEFFGMPDAAIRTGVVDRVLPLDEIAPSLLSWVGRSG